MQFSMKQFLTGILNSDSYRLSAYSTGHRSLEAIGGVRPRYVGVTWARAATRIRAGLAARSADGAALPHRAQGGLHPVRRSPDRMFARR